METDRRWIMDGRIKRLTAVIILGGTLLACGFPFENQTPSIQRTMLASTVFLMQTQLATLQTPAPSNTVIPTPVITATETFTPLPTAQNPLVIRDTLCWRGPGPGYVVSSAVHAGTRVILLGQGSIPGWWVIEGPVYHDACWIYQQDLQIDPGYSFQGLRTYDPPATPRPTKTKTP
jgi:hypothetical protein